MSYGRRRVPGLRREELAQLAGVSVDYYVRVEQGRTRGVSDAVLDALASALRLSETERRHLRNLARPSRGKAHRPSTEQVRPGLRQLLDAVHEVPAYVMSWRGDVLAWNRIAALVFGDFGATAPEERNLARMIFLDEKLRHIYADWDSKARETVGFLRLAAGRHPEDSALTALVGELSMKSETFRKYWADHTIREKTHGRKRLRHPMAGELVLDYETLTFSDSEQILITYSAEAGSTSHEALRFLASWQSTAESTEPSADRA